MTFDQWWDEYVKQPDNYALSEYEKDVARDAWRAARPEGGAPVAWRWRVRGTDYGWNVTEREIVSSDEIEVRPLYECLPQLYPSNETKSQETK